jgi:hypothetical protein
VEESCLYLRNLCRRFGGVPYTEIARLRARGVIDSASSEFDFIEIIVFRPKEEIPWPKSLTASAWRR